MEFDLEKINNFIKQHHVLSLASSYKDEVHACSLFYAYSEKIKTFVVASSDDTTHIQDIKQNSQVAGNILLETKNIGKIQGLQLRGKFILLKDMELEKLYFENFPYARALSPQLWQINVNYFKMTDNRLGFGKKIIWSDS